MSPVTGNSSVRVRKAANRAVLGMGWTKGFERETGGGQRIGSPPEGVRQGLRIALGIDHHAPFRREAGEGVRQHGQGFVLDDDEVRLNLP